MYNEYEEIERLEYNLMIAKECGNLEAVEEIEERIFNIMERMEGIKND